MNRPVKVLVALVVGLVVAGSAFLAGFFSGGLLHRSAPSGDGSLGEVVEEVAQLVRIQALEPSGEESMTAGAVRGLLDSLDDPYAAYFDKEHYRYVSEMNSGQFYGIGVTVTERDGRVVIVAPIEGTPAFEAGLLAEDVIVSVDGFEPEEWTLDDVVARIRGEEGTDVTIGIRRTNGGEREFEVTITRARIDVPNSTAELLDDDIGYIALGSFNGKAADDVRDHLEALAAEGARGFILDLRDNPGGLLDSSIEVSSLFIEDGVVVRVEERDGSEDEYRALGETVTDAPLVVLVNENSASASEIVAGALQDHSRATVVGAATFGKASVQAIEELSNGGAVKFTTAGYVTPRGRSLSKSGLEPDVVVDMSPRDQTDRDTDVQFQRAVEVLLSELGG